MIVIMIIIGDQVFFFFQGFFCSQNASLNTCLRLEDSVVRRLQNNAFLLSMFVSNTEVLIFVSPNFYDPTRLTVEMIVSEQQKEDLF